MPTATTSGASGSAGNCGARSVPGSPRQNRRTTDVVCTPTTCDDYSGLPSHRCVPVPDRVERERLSRGAPRDADRVDSTCFRRFTARLGARSGRLDARRGIAPGAAQYGSERSPRPRGRGGAGRLSRRSGAATSHELSARDPAVGQRQAPGRDGNAATPESGRGGSRSERESAARGRRTPPRRCRPANRRFQAATRSPSGREACGAARSSVGRYRPTCTPSRGQVAARLASSAKTRGAALEKPGAAAGARRTPRSGADEARSHRDPALREQGRRAPGREPCTYRTRAGALDSGSPVRGRLTGSS